MSDHHEQVWTDILTLQRNDRFTAAELHRLRAQTTQLEHAIARMTDEIAILQRASYTTDRAPAPTTRLTDRWQDDRDAPPDDDHDDDPPRISFSGPAYHAAATYHPITTMDDILALNTLTIAGLLPPGPRTNADLYRLHASFLCHARAYEPPCGWSSWNHAWDHYTAAGMPIVSCDHL